MSQNSQNQRVEFFHTQSSFDSLSRLSSFQEQQMKELADETQLIFGNLKSILYPRFQLVNQEHLDHILHRGKILFKQTIPTHRQNSIQSSSFPNQINEMFFKLRKLFDDYEKWQGGTLSYQQFYSIYGKSSQNFVKKKNLQVEVVDIWQDEAFLDDQRGKTGYFNKWLKSPRKWEQNWRQKEIDELKDEISRLKKRQKKININHEKIINDLKISQEKRIKNLLVALKSETSCFGVEFDEKQKDIENQFNLNQKQREEIKKLQSTIEELNYEIQILKNQREQQRKMSLDRSQSLQNFDGYSPRSENNGGKNQREQQKRIEKLLYENNLLKIQLNKERKIKQKQKKSSIEQYQTELILAKKTIQLQNEEISELKSQFDKQSIKITKLIDHCSSQEKMLRKISVSSDYEPQLQSMTLQTKSKTIKPGHQYHIKSYTGSGLEGQTYFRMLNFQFQIRYRRSCLKQKELIYKGNGLEMGIISNFDGSAIIINFFCSNYSQSQTIHDLKMKAINFGGNSFHHQSFQLSKLKSSDQAKFQMQFEPKQYPIGESILICEYSYYGKKQSNRILLPTSILKMMKINPIDGQFRSPKSLKIDLQRKILKELLGYFEGGTIREQKVKCSITHQQTETKLLLSFEIKQRTVHLKYEHRVGEQSITEYFVACLEFLIKK